MALDVQFWKRLHGGDVTGVGKSPLRRHISQFKLKKFRDTRAAEKSRAGAKKTQDIEGINPDTHVRLMPMKK